MTLPAQQLTAQVAAARRLGLAARRRRIPASTRPKLIESDYAGRLVAIIAGWRAAYERQLPAILGDLPAEQRRDEDTTPRVRSALEQAREEAEASINVTQLEGIAGDMATRVSAHQRRDLQRQSKAALGVEVRFLDGGLDGVIRGFVRENVALIKKLKNATLDELDSIVIRGFASGTRADALGAEIAKRFGASERHARMIAMDQVGKLNGQITEARHTELGIKSYEWQSLLVGKRRPEHLARHGRRYRYDQPPADGHPGRAVCCRCLQKPVFDGIYAELDALGV